MSCILTHKAPYTLARKISAVSFFTALLLFLTGCGYNYRPVVDVVPKPGGDPQAFALALVVNNGGTPGSTSELNVSGDTNAGNFLAGQGPVHAAYLGGLSAAFVANRDSDTVSAYAPTQAATEVQTISLPSASRPVYIVSSETPTNGNCFSGNNARSACVYVANSGTNSVGIIDSNLLVLQNSGIPVGNKPVAMVETPDARKLYVANQIDGTVSVITTADMKNIATLAVGSNPVWMLLRNDGARLYVVNQSSSTVTVIDTSADTVINTLAVGASPVHAFFDNRLQRLWVVNGAANTVSVFAADTDTLPLLATIPVGASPVAVTVLADGSRAYVVNSASNNVSIISSLNFSITKTVPVGLSPSWIASSSDSSKVFTTNRTSNSVSILRTSDDSIVTTLPTGSSSPVFVTVGP
jgi:YVTN family beta-propeller protein